MLERHQLTSGDILYKENLLQRGSSPAHDRTVAAGLFPDCLEQECEYSETNMTTPRKYFVGNILYS